MGLAGKKWYKTYSPNETLPKDFPIEYNTLLGYRRNKIISGDRKPIARVRDIVKGGEVLKLHRDDKGVLITYTKHLIKSTTPTRVKTQSVDFSDIIQGCIIDLIILDRSEESKRLVKFLDNYRKHFLQCLNVQKGVEFLTKDILRQADNDIKQRAKYYKVTNYIEGDEDGW